MVKDTSTFEWKQEKMKDKEKSPASGRIRTHNLLTLRRVLYCRATSAAQLSWTWWTIVPPLFSYIIIRFNISWVYHCKKNHRQVLIGRCYYQDLVFHQLSEVKSPEVAGWEARIPHQHLCYDIPQDSYSFYGYMNCLTVMNHSVSLLLQLFIRLRMLKSSDNRRWIWSTAK